MSRRKRIYPPFKRAFDILGAILLLIISSPLMLITALLVRINLGSPVIFAQPRPGLNEHLFTLYKFRSMKQIDQRNGLITDSDRLGKFGRLLRASSIDELPSLWNVLIGNMSFIGPRPLLVEYLPLYTEQERKRHSVRPGITGLAQVSGRNSITWEEKFTLDVLYVKQISLSLDIQILLNTLKTVFRAKNINSPGSATATKFSR